MLDSVHAADECFSEVHNKNYEAKNTAFHFVQVAYLFLDCLILVWEWRGSIIARYWTLCNVKLAIQVWSLVIYLANKQHFEPTVPRVFLLSSRNVRMPRWVENSYGCRTDCLGTIMRGASISLLVDTLHASGPSGTVDSRCKLVNYVESSQSTVKKSTVESMSSSITNTRWYAIRNCW